MKVRFACTIAIAFLLATSAFAQKSTTIGHLNGSEGDIFDGCNTDGYCLFLSVSQLVDPNGVSLTFAIRTPVADQSINGSGLIPASAFTVSRDRLTLNVDTSTLSGFTTELCDFNGCTPYPGGVISLTWNASGTVIRTTGTSIIGDAFASARHTGTFTINNATASGTILGQQFTATDLAGFADIVTSRGAEIDIIR